MEQKNNLHDNENQYTSTYKRKCPTDASEVTHTVIYQKATCTRVDDVIQHFSCSRDSKCVKCYQDYL